MQFHTIHMEKHIQFIAAIWKSDEVVIHMVIQKRRILHMVIHKFGGIPYGNPYEYL